MRWRKWVGCCALADLTYREERYARGRRLWVHLDDLDELVMRGLVAALGAPEAANDQLFALDERTATAH